MNTLEAVSSAPASLTTGLSQRNNSLPKSAKKVNLRKRCLRTAIKKSIENLLKQSTTDLCIINPDAAIDKSGSTDNVTLITLQVS